MFVGEARSLPLSGKPERCFTWVGSSATCYCSESHYAECRYVGNAIFIIMMSVFLLNVIMLYVIMLNVIMLYVIMLNVYAE